MSWFIKKKDKIIDLSKPLNERKREEENPSIEVNFPAEVQEDKVIDLTEVEEKKKNLAKRISDMIEKMDGLSTKIYHLEQRIEVLEKRTRVNNFDADGRGDDRE
jgi:uncharacterized protein YhaN